MDDQDGNLSNDQEPLMEAVNTSSAAFLDRNDEQEYLRATWEKLGVVQDGLFSLNDLNKVCEATGIEEESIQVIKNLFEGLDLDGDGRITFDEFMQIFGTANQSQVSENKNHDKSLDNLKNLMSPQTPDVFSEIRLHSLDPDDTGFVQVSRLIEIWCDLDLPSGENFLKDLQLPYNPLQRIHMSELNSSLAADLRRQRDEGGAIKQKLYGFHLLLYEIRDLRSNLDTSYEERKKYKVDLLEANQRICRLVQEIDEHSTQVETASKKQICNLERQYKEQLKEMQDALKNEQELSRDKVTDINTDIKQIQNKNDILKEEENRLKHQIALQDNDIRKLVCENVEVTDNLKDTQRQVEFLEKQMAELRFMERKINEYEEASPREDAYESLQRKVEQLVSQNQILRDKNDELLSKMDKLSRKETFCQETGEHSLEGSVIGDYLNSATVISPGSLKRRSHRSCSRERDSKIMKKSCNFYEKHINIHYADVAAGDESFDPNFSLPMEKFHCSPFQSWDVVPKSGGHYTESPNSLHQSSLGPDLLKTDDLFRNAGTNIDRIHPVCSTPHKTKCYNCDHVIEKLKNFDDILSQMKIEDDNFVNSELKSCNKSTTKLENKSLTAGINTTVIIGELQDRLEIAVKTFNILLKRYETGKMNLDELVSRCHGIAEKIKRRRISLTRFMAEALPGEGITTIPEEDEVPTGIDLLEGEFTLYEEKISREKDTLEKQKAVVEERNVRIEKELEILKADLGSADDYWQMKIKEEQDYYEEERKLYDEKWVELEKKIKEYEVLLKIDSSSTVQTENSDESDRLSTIDENVYWEKQITELEEELKMLQQNNDSLAKEKDHLKLSYENELKNSISKFEAELLALKLETEFLRAKLRASDAKSVKAKEVREDGNRHKNETDPHYSFDVSNQLGHARKRIYKLEGALKILQKSTCEILSKTQELHQAEIESHQTIVDSTQQMLTSCLAKYKDQTIKVFRTDSLVKNLYLENTHLMIALQVTEERQKKAESILRNLEMSRIK